MSEKKYCLHPSRKLYAWFAFNHLNGKTDILCIGCCECGEIIKGGYE